MTGGVPREKTDTLATSSHRKRSGALIVLALLVGCGDAPEPASTTRPTPEPAAETRAETGLVMPSAGKVRIRVGEDGLTLLANAAPRRSLLEALSRQLGFELVAPDVGDEPITTRIEGGHLRDALPDLLPDRAYRVEYGVDPTTARHEVARLEIAASGLQAMTKPAERTPEHRPAEEGTIEAYPATSARSSLEERSKERIDWKEIALRLDDADAEERIETLQQIDPEGDGVALIADRLARDPDPRVRLAAAQRFEFAETLAAVDALLEALHDPHKAVVLAAIDALEFSDDTTIAEDLTRMRPHPDPQIDEALEEAIDFLVDD